MDSLDFEALRSIGLTTPMRQQLPSLDLDENTRLLRVVEVQREHLLLHDGQAEQRGRLATALVDRLQQDDDAVAVGDWVLVRPDGQGGGHITERLAPLTQLARRVNDGRGSPRRQVLVSNVDTALLVMGLDHDFNLRRLERYLALVRLAGVDALLVLTKADTVDVAQLARRTAQARDCLPAAMSLLALDSRDARAASALQPWVGAGQTLVLLGSSGAGKSTLTNTLTGLQSGQGGQFTGAVRADDSRGRHTTTVRTLRRTAAGACIIDTPGLRALRLDVGDEEQLSEVFGDVARWAASCRFRDCRHQDEPGCAVREAVPPERLRNFQKLLREARRDAMTVLERREQLAVWKARGREGAMRAKAKRSG
ncbi:ribosome small subunit-dependent GTPase A [Aquabacterium sp.]|uniref:ribosome small subunit-dependent GTPase A n=1 Tax=Aquabacterium sp. TaxID=1872578 RepID=UPI002B8D9B56|nr:ribosome small subunit-dependent GTPase A [Aquabacterium sp.]HSW08261.1 ribosome small subunit-dependent GTPase A [Aquabacterium sp.]